MVGIAIAGLEDRRLLCSSAGTATLATSRAGGRSGSIGSRSTLTMQEQRHDETSRGRERNAMHIPNVLNYICHIRGRQEKTTF